MNRGIAIEIMAGETGVVYEANASGSWCSSCFQSRGRSSRECRIRHQRLQPLLLGHTQVQTLESTPRTQTH